MPYCEKMKIAYGVANVVSASDHRPRGCCRAIDLHDPVDRDRQERCRDHIGHQRGVGQHPALAQPHPADREAGQRADEQRQERHHQADDRSCCRTDARNVRGTRSLVTTTRKLSSDGMFRPDRAAEDVVVAVERDHPHVVDRRDATRRASTKPSSQARRFRRIASQPVASAAERDPAVPAVVALIAGPPTCEACASAGRPAGSATAARSSPPPRRGAAARR